MNAGHLRTLAILTAMTCGALLPQAHVLEGAIRWLIMGMLFLVFLQVRFHREALQPSHALLFAANLAMGFAAWGFGWLVGGRDLALAAFFAGITPTAAAAPVIISFLRGRVDYVVAAFLLTNLGIAALLPFLLPLVLGRAVPALMAQVFASVGQVIFVPLALAWLLRLAHPPAAAWPGRLRNFSFGLWLGSMFIITARASDFIRGQAETPVRTLVGIAVVTAFVCAANFALGRLVGGREFRREASQSLGQKNTAFTVYLALTYASPLVALGPTFYIVCHNLWNAWQLHRLGRAASREERP